MSWSWLFQSLFQLLFQSFLDVPELAFSVVVVSCVPEDPYVTVWVIACWVVAGIVESGSGCRCWRGLLSRCFGC